MHIARQQRGVVDERGPQCQYGHLGVETGFVG